MDTTDYPLSSSRYYYNGSLTITNGGTDWIQQRHTPTPFVLDGILLKCTLTNNRHGFDTAGYASGNYSTEPRYQ